MSGVVAISHRHAGRDLLQTLDTRATMMTRIDRPEATEGEGNPSCTVQLARGVGPGPQDLHERLGGFEHRIGNLVRCHKIDVCTGDD